MLDRAPCGPGPIALPEVPARARTLSPAPCRVRLVCAVDDPGQQQEITLAMSPGVPVPAQALIPNGVVGRTPAWVIHP